MFATSWLRAEPRASAALAYALTGAVVASALYQLEEYYSHIAPPVLFFPLIFLVPYIRFLIRQASAKQRVLAVVLNALAAAVTAGYLRTIPIWPPRSEPPFPMILLGAVVVPASFVLAAIALFCRHRLAYAAGTLATLVAWPCVALIAAELQSFAVAYRLATLGCILSLLAFSIACFSVFLKNPPLGTTRDY